MSDENKRKVEKPVTPARRRVNSLLFFAVATLANLAVMMVILLLLLLLYVTTLSQHVSQLAGQIIILASVVVSVGVSYVCYHFFMRWLSTRIDLDRYFDPIFRIGGKH